MESRRKSSPLLWVNRSLVRDFKQQSDKPDFWHVKGRAQLGTLAPAKSLLHGKVRNDGDFWQQCSNGLDKWLDSGYILKEYPVEFGDKLEVGIWEGEVGYIFPPQN